MYIMKLWYNTLSKTKNIYSYEPKFFNYFRIAGRFSISSINSSGSNDTSTIFTKYVHTQGNSSLNCRIEISNATKYAVYVKTFRHVRECCQDALRALTTFCVDNFIAVIYSRGNFTTDNFFLGYLFLEYIIFWIFFHGLFFPTPATPNKQWIILIKTNYWG